MATKNYSELRKRLQKRLAENPSARAAYETKRRAVRDALALADIRSSRGITQVEMAAHLKVTQGSVSQTERQSDLYLSTLEKYVEALGGHLELNAVFPDETIHVAIDHR
jgi:DNA-binding XRE family transcriptional regulator